VQPKITGKKYVGLPHRPIIVYKFKNDLLKKMDCIKNDISKWWVGSNISWALIIL
jgi:hypothetical protein